MSDALFCALKDSDGASADGTFATPVGRFGIASHIRVPKWDPAARQVVGQRLGTLYLFGIPMDIEDQDYVASFPTERDLSLPLRPVTGYYMDLQSSIVSWQMHGSGQVGLFTLGLGLGQNGYFWSMNNNAFALSPNDGNNHYDAALSWQSWQDRCNACTPSRWKVCDCPSGSDVAAHNAFAGYTDAQYRNLTDGILPYEAQTGGVSGDHVYRQSSLDWTQIGFANGGTGIAVDGNDGDPAHNAANNPSTYLDFSFALGFDIVELGLDLQVKFRSGMELTQRFDPSTDSAGTAYVDTTVDAESTIQLPAHLTIKNPFPFGPDYLVDETFEVFPAITNPAHAPAASIAYDLNQGFPFRGYNTAATGDQSGNAQAAHDRCVTTPQADGALTPPHNPETLLSSVVTSAQQQMWPCNIELCQPSAAASTTGTLQLCQWNFTTKKVDCTPTTTPCNVCQDSHADLCLADGSVRPGGASTGHGLCAGPR